MSVFSYNGVTLPYPSHSDFRQESVYDDTGQTDRILTKYDLTVQSIIHPDYLSVLAPEVNSADASAADIMAYVRLKLLKPRRLLTVQLNGVNLLPTVASGNSGTADAKNGPMPQHCSVNTLNASFLITFRIVANYWENPTLTPNGALAVGRNQPGDAVLYNRWTETQDIDDRLYTTFTRDGKFVIRSDNVDGQIADFYREKMCALGVKQKCNRVSSRYTVTPDGLGLQYTVQDRQYFRPYPYPAYKASGTVLDAGDIGPRRVLEARITLEGPPNADQARLMAVAMNIATSRLIKRTQTIGGQGLIVRNSSFQPDMWDNRVTVMVQSQTNAFRKGNGKLTYKQLRDLVDMPLGGAAGLQTDYNAQGISLWTNGHPDYPVRGAMDSTFLLRAAAYWDPSLRNHGIVPATGQFNPGGLQVGQAGKNAES